MALIEALLWHKLAYSLGQVILFCLVLGVSRTDKRDTPGVIVLWTLLAVSIAGAFYDLLLLLVLKWDTTFTASRDIMTLS